MNTSCEYPEYSRILAYTRIYIPKQPRGVGLEVSESELLVSVNTSLSSYCSAAQMGIIGSSGCLMRAHAVVGIVLLWM